MRILGIDPGPIESGWVILHAEQKSVVSSGITGNDDLLTRFALNEYRLAHGDIVAFEKVASFGMAVGAEVFETVFWTGRFFQVFESAVEMFKLIRLTRHEIKMHLCHTDRSTDSNIRQALIDKLGPPGTKKQPGPTYGISKHKWAALAVAVVASEQTPVVHQYEQEQQTTHLRD